jgi:hypothetical protein
VGLEQAPTFSGLAPDERLARFALGMERVEILFQPFF